VTLVEYGDFECPYCGQAEQVIRELLASFGDDVRYVWRHLPLNDVHPSAQLAAEASEAAAAQGKFWEMHDLLLAHQGDLAPATSSDYATDSSASTSSASSTSCAAARVRAAGQRGRRSADESGCPARRRSSSTAAATTAPTTSTRWTS
jgi:protein-disulfide isomerase